MSEALHFWEDFFPPLSMWTNFLPPTPLPCGLWTWQEVIQPRQWRELYEYSSYPPVFMTEPQGRFAWAARHSGGRRSRPMSRYRAPRVI